MVKTINTAQYTSLIETNERPIVLDFGSNG